MRPIVSDTWLRKRFAALSYPAPANDPFETDAEFFARLSRETAAPERGS